MQENTFLNYLLKTKYNKSTDLKNIINSLSINNDLKNQLLELTKENFEKQTLLETLTKVEKNLNTNIPPIYSDILFCQINSNKTALKILKDKDINLPNLRQVYQTSFANNKLLLRDFNLKPKKEKIITSLTKQTTRFAPEPAGCLHIGHVKALLVNYNLAKSTNGTFLLRFDDTNSEKRYDIFEPEIIKDLEILGITDYKVSHSSDYFDFLVEKAKLLINKNLAYCDDTPPDQLKQERMDGIESKRRNTPINENIKIFDDMLHGRSNYCLRAKIDMSNPNKTMRDPVIYRVSQSKHCRNDKYKSFPTYDFVCPILDSIENVTTACRANEYRDRNLQYNWFLNNLELENKPKISDFAKLNFEDTVLSKRKIEELIKNKVVDSWEDPRLSTIRGIKRAGMDIEALKEYINLQGASYKTNVISWDKVWAMNKKAIDLKSPRFMGIKKENCVFVELENDIINESDENTEEKEVYLKDTENQLDGFDKKLKKLNEKLENTYLNSNSFDNNTMLENKKITEISEIKNNKTINNLPYRTKKIPLHKKNSELGFKNVIYDKTLLISQDDAQMLDVKEEFTLMNWGNCIILEKIIKNNLVVKIRAKLNLNGDYKKTKNKISWISELGAVSVKVVEYDKIEKTESIWYIESAFTDWMEVDKHFQIERYGYLYVDKPFVLNLVPFTKQKRTY